MREFEHKRKVRRILSSPLVLIPLAIISIFLIRGTWNIYQKDRASLGELRASQERLQRLEERQKKLQEATQRLGTESGVEAEIRDRFQMAKVGEREIVIVENASEPEQIVPVSESFLQKIVDFFTIR